MSHLYLIRHAQASFFSDNYDALSDLGIQQSERLATHLLERGARFDHAFVGPKQRHQHTQQIVRDTFLANGAPFPDTDQLDTFNEFAAGKVLEHGVAQWAPRDPDVAQLKHNLDNANGDTDTLRHFQFLFENVVGKWVEGRVDCDGFETWAAFKTRVLEGLKHIQAEHQNGQSVAVFTSLGPIAAALAGVTGMDDATTWRTAWRLRNASVTHIVFDANRITLESLNNTGHLSPGLVTFR
ncbi:MAG: histidine phosphatase family protein [Planctomycetota bacterium]|jgi:broad specificity phosphatase PhoE